MVRSDIHEISQKFFSELKQYNRTNFHELERADLEELDPKSLKAFSSVPTRYLIFCEKHPEYSELEKNMLWFQLKIDMIARFFSNFPNTNQDDLKAFQTELRCYIGGDTDE